MAKVDVERAYVKCLAKAPLTLNEVDELKVMGASDLIELGSIAEAAFVRMWVRHETYRHRAQDLMNGRNPQDDGTGFAQPPSRTWPFYESD
ncbi:MAG TPA: hypothetical protein EYQ00_08305 [Dehalococcoidia bacterium]|jgi:hypothetical protein|nr:hypothetical protein [Dehalococcoidia bacterium]